MDAGKNDPAPPPVSGESEETSKGIWAATAAFSIWGILPLYWKQLAAVLPLEVICHRGVWSFLMVLPFAVLTGRMTETRGALQPRSLGLLFCSSSVLAANWLIFIWAVNNGQILETSLGNYINPLFNMLCGMLFFRDRPSRLQWCAILLAVFGVSVRIVSLGHLPWVALGLPCTFCVYGVLRKIVKVEAVPGMLVETGLFAPFALGGIAYFAAAGHSAFGPANSFESALLVGGGLVTSIPMSFFAYGARHLKLTTLGVLHYIVPSASFLIGVFIYDEPFTRGHALTFGCIWLALCLYTVDIWRKFHPSGPARSA